MTTIYDVARKANVSHGTVSRYLSGNGYVGKIARERIKLAIEELNYSPSGVARGLTNKRTYMLGFVVSDLVNPFIPELVRGAQDLADDEGYCMLIYNTDGREEREVRALNLLYEHRVDGLIVTPPETVKGNQCILELQERGLPIVSIGRKLKSPGIDRVSTDTYQGAIAAVLHLVALGHRRIAFIGGEVAPGIALSRRQGYIDALQQADLPLVASYLVEAPLSREGGCAALSSLLSLPYAPTAIFTANDIVAIGAIQEIVRRGGRVPEDVSIVGFDDILLAANVQPALTTISQPKQLIGRTAVELLLAHIEQGDKHVAQEIRLPCVLVVRESTAPLSL